VARQGIRLYGDPILRARCGPVEPTAASTRTLVADLFDTMYDARGVGLAACQIGVPARVFVLDCSAIVPGSPKLAVINPEVLSQGTPKTGEEGCLSFPDLYLDVSRPERAKVRFSSPDGEECELQASGLLARAFLHEFDHLDGVLYTDRQSALKRLLLAGRLWNFKRRCRHGEHA
jgi:peptide deformylase